jgi:ATP-dependent RNA helicase DeaD
MTTFESLGLDERILKAVSALGFEIPSEIQQKAIPELLSGKRDLVGLAQTGTGKTAAFGLPLIELTDFSSRDVQAVVLCPTRELCVQITKDFESYAKNYRDTNIVAVYGGASIDTQIRQIKKGAQIIVATPGRMADMVNRNAVNLENVKIVVLDEADEMLDMGFKDDLDIILNQTPSTRNTWLFSATMSKEVARIASNYMSDPFEITVGGKNSGAKNIEHQYYVMHYTNKYAALKRIVDFYPDIFAIVFCRTKRETQEIAEKLIKDGYNADALHGDLSQAQRDKVMDRYRNRSLQLLIATDVAARGIDVNDVTHVIHYGLPEDVENYTHRSGRTARAGKSGISICITTTKEVYKVRDIERLIGAKFEKKLVPSGEEVCEKQFVSHLGKVLNAEIKEKELKRFMPIIEEFSEGLTSEEIIKKFISHSFNNLLNYYKDSVDINTAKGVREERGDREEGGRGRDRNDGFARYFINIGKKDNINVGALLNLVCTESGLKGADFGRIDLKDSFSFLDVREEDVNEFEKGMKGAEFNGRKVNVEKSVAPSGGSGGGGGRSSSRGGRKDFSSSRGGESRGEGRGHRKGGSSSGTNGYSGSTGKERRRRVDSPSSNSSAGGKKQKFY